MMVYFTTNAVHYDGKTGRSTVPNALYNNFDRWELFPMLNNSIFYRVEIKRGGTRMIEGVRFPKEGAVVKYVNR